MNSVVVSLVFALVLLASLLVRFWLATRQIRHVDRHRASVPAAYRDQVTLEAHQKAADYTIAKLRLQLLSEAVGTAVLLGWTLLGGLDLLNVWLRDLIAPRWGAMPYELALFGSFMLVSGALDLPFELWRIFRLEESFGFNKVTLRLFIGDTLKQTALLAVLGLPILALVLWIMRSTGPLWWLWAWGAWTAFQLFVQWIAPTVIAPLFNKFEPLKDEAVAQRVTALMQRCGFTARGCFVMDGSRRSAHSNAYFTGFGGNKRVVFFDTLLARLSGEQLEAVLAHELGHFKHRHVLKRTLAMVGISLAGLALLGWLAQQGGFYLGLGVTPNLDAPNAALALLLFMMASPAFMFFISPLMAQLSRKDEFEADRYAARMASAPELVQALLKLYESNASTLTPDPLYVRFYYSHPPASERIAALQAAGALAAQGAAA